MNDYGMIIEPGTLRIQRLLPGPIERVWAYLTESDKRATWLAAGAMKLESCSRPHRVIRCSSARSANAASSTRAARRASRCWASRWR